MNYTNGTFPLPTYTLYLTGVSSGLSIFGCLAIFLTYYMFEDIRNSNRTLLVHLTLADLLTAVGYFVGNIHYAVDFHQSGQKQQVTDGLCVAQSFVTTFSNMASYFWTVVIAVQISTLVRRHSDLASKPLWRLFFHVICWGAPAVIAIAALSCDVLGVDYTVGSGSWCFIRSDVTPRWRLTTWIMVSAAGWEMLCYLVTCLLYIHLKFYLFRGYRQIALSQVQATLRNEDKNFMYVWFVLYLLKMWGTIRFLIVTFKPDVYNSGEGWSTLLMVLLGMQSFGAAGQGFWNFVIFCLMDQTVRNNAKRFTRDCCRGRQASENSHLIQNERTDRHNAVESYESIA